MTTEVSTASRPSSGTPAPATRSVVILIPVLRRPHRVQPLLESVEATTKQPWRVMFIHDPDDVPEAEAIRRAGGSGISCAGNYATKINAGASMTDEDLIFLGADDVRFHPEWLENAAQWIKHGFLVVGTNDLCNPAVIRGDHATHFLVHRDYVSLGTIDERSKLLHEGYEHEYVDNEFIETAKSRHMYAHAGNSIVEHLHPMVGKAPMDDVYAGQRYRMRQGRQLFDQRKRLWRD